MTRELGPWHTIYEYPTLTVHPGNGRNSGLHTRLEMIGYGLLGVGHQADSRRTVLDLDEHNGGLAGRTPYWKRQPWTGTPKQWGTVVRPALGSLTVHPSMTEVVATVHVLAPVRI